MCYDDPQKRSLLREKDQRKGEILVPNPNVDPLLTKGEFAKL